MSQVRYRYFNPHVAKKLQTISVTAEDLQHSSEIASFAETLKNELVSLERIMDGEHRRVKKQAVASILKNIAAELEEEVIAPFDAPQDSLTSCVLIDSHDSSESKRKQSPIQKTPQSQPAPSTKRSKRSGSQAPSASNKKRDVAPMAVTNLSAQLKADGRWNAYSWYVYCRRPELERANIKGLSVMAVCGREWADLQKNPRRLKTWLEQVLHFVSEHSPPLATAGETELTKYKQLIAAHLASPYAGELTDHASSFSNAK